MIAVKAALQYSTSSLSSYLFPLFFLYLLLSLSSLLFLSPHPFLSPLIFAFYLLYSPLLFLSHPLAHDLHLSISFLPFKSSLNLSYLILFRHAEGSFDDVAYEAAKEHLKVNLATLYIMKLNI